MNLEEMVRKYKLLTTIELSRRYSQYFLFKKTNTLQNCDELTRDIEQVCVNFNIKQASDEVCKILLEELVERYLNIYWKTKDIIKSETEIKNHYDNIIRLKNEIF